MSDALPLSLIQVTKLLAAFIHSIAYHVRVISKLVIAQITSKGDDKRSSSLRDTPYVYAFRTKKVQVASIHTVVETICLRHRGNRNQMIVYK